MGFRRKADLSLRANKAGIFRDVERKTSSSLMFDTNFLLLYPSDRSTAGDESGVKIWFFNGEFANIFEGDEKCIVDEE
jgi:hypothetical protein